MQGAYSQKKSITVLICEEFASRVNCAWTKISLTVVKYEL